MNLHNLITAISGPQFVSIEEIAAVAEGAKGWEKLCTLGGVDVYQVTDADGRAMRLMQSSIDGSGILERLPITAANPRAWS